MVWTRPSRSALGLSALFINGVFSWFIMDTSDLKLLGVFCHYRARRTGSWVSNSGTIGLAYSRSTIHSVIARDWTLGLGLVMWGTGYTYSFGWARCLRQAKGMHRRLNSPPARVTHLVLFIGVLSSCICLWHGHWGKDPKTKNRRGKSVLVSKHNNKLRRGRRV